MARGKKQVEAEKLKRLMFRSNEEVLLWMVMAFQFLALTLLAFKNQEVDGPTLLCAVGLPAWTAGSLFWLRRRVPIDRAFYILMMFLISVGIITIRCIYHSFDKAFTQIIYMVVGYGALWGGIGLVRGIRHWRSWIRPGIALLVGLLLLPYVLGSSRDTARVWVYIGSYQFQPLEFGKPLLIMVLAALFSASDLRRAYALGLAFSASLCLILVIAHDMGAVILYFFIAVGMYYMASQRIKPTLGLLGAAAAAGAGIYFYSLETGRMSYLLKRIEIWRNPWAYADGTGRQLVQGLISIASGGWLGSGLGLGSPSKVYVSDSDYIFAAINEEFGMIVALCVVGVYALLVFRGMSTALNARNRYHALLAAGTMLMVALQTAIIIGGNVQLLPLTGVTLPLVSSGGSSLIGVMGAMGLVLGVSSINAQDEYDDFIAMGGVA